MNAVNVLANPPKIQNDAAENSETVAQKSQFNEK
jgi:hypothetical protein